MSKLGDKLKEVRELAGFTLRNVEEVTGVSNAYLSQLENGKIKKPSANVLYKLATFYRISTDSLMIAAGFYSEEHTIEQKEGVIYLNGVAISTEEEQQLIDYLKFLRHKR